MLTCLQTTRPAAQLQCTDDMGTIIEKRGANLLSERKVISALKL